MVSDRAGNRPAFAPEHLCNVWASRTFTQGLSVGIGGRYLGEQFIAEDNVFAADDSFIASAMVSYDWDRYRIALNAENATAWPLYTSPSPRDP